MIYAPQLLIKNLTEKLVHAAFRRPKNESTHLKSMGKLKIEKRLLNRLLYQITPP